MDDDGTSLIPAATRALIGKPESGSVSAVITAEGSQRYAQAVGDLNPVYFHVDAAQAAGYRDLIVPPTYVQYALVRGRSLADLRADGLFHSRQSAMVLRVSRTMFGGEEWDFLGPVHVGDRITATGRLAGLDEKQGTKGPFVRITRETTFTNQHGDVVARTRQIGIAR